MKILATYSIKGGVGKTTSAVNLAYEAAQAGARVLVWDLDPQGAATYFLRAKPRMKGGADRLVGKKGNLEPHVRSTDYPPIHVIAADFSLRNLDVALDDIKKPVERLARLLAPVADHYDVAYVSTTSLDLSYLDDRLHLTQEGHAEFGDYVASQLSALGG